MTNQCLNKAHHPLFPILSDDRVASSLITRFVLDRVGATHKNARKKTRRFSEIFTKNYFPSQISRYLVGIWFSQAWDIIKTRLLIEDDEIKMNLATQIWNQKRQISRPKNRQKAEKISKHALAQCRELPMSEYSKQFSSLDVFKAQLKNLKLVLLEHGSFSSFTERTFCGKFFSFGILS